MGSNCSLILLFAADLISIDSNKCLTIIGPRLYRGVVRLPIRDLRNRNNGTYIRIVFSLINSLINSVSQIPKLFLKHLLSEKDAMDSMIFQSEM